MRISDWSSDVCSSDLTASQASKPPPKPASLAPARRSPQLLSCMSSPLPQFDGKDFVRGLSTAPGVYRMFAADDSVLYVGKAGALKKRVARDRKSTRLNSSH